MGGLIVMIVIWAVAMLWLGERLDHRLNDKFASALLTVGIAIVTFLPVLLVAA